MSDVTRNYFLSKFYVKGVRMNNFLNVTTSLLLLSLLISKSNQFKIAHNITKTGSRIMNKTRFLA